ncbi:putative SIT4 phosphatase-associated protein family [Septoria linicola]|nr:putative SIT4 phosphatase-associated protein family [Septoria linicola]
MFWRFGGYANISTIDTILDKQDVTLEELLDESDLIQELKQQNSKLIEFLRDDERLKKLLTYVIAEPKPEEDAASPAGKDQKDAAPGTPKSPGDEEKTGGISFFTGKSRARSKSANKSSPDGETEQEKNEAQRKKYAYVACEVLSSEVWSISEALLEQRENLRGFWQYLKRPAPLDPLQAGYFTKVNEALLDKKTEDMLDFFRNLEGIVPAMLQHVDCPMVMDLLLKIISLEKHEGGQGIVDWLQQQNLIPLLLEYLSDQHSGATQTSAGDFLKAIITISANATTQDQSVIGPNELTRQLVSPPCIQQLINGMLKGGNPLTVGVGIVIEVIRKNNSDYDLDNQVGPEPKTSDPIYLGTLLRKFATHVPDFMHLIRSADAQKPELKAAFGRKIQPLGFDRFKTCELMAELLHCSNMGLLNERGADEEISKRDAERERLKAEGKLATPRARQSPTPDVSHDEFGSSVDSHGFHHAERPSEDDLSEKTDDIRKLEVQNASDEDGFEKVNAPPDELPEEVTFDDLNEKIDDATHGGLPKLEKVEKRDPSDPQNKSPQSPVSPSALPQPLSPKKNAASPSKSSLLHFDPPPTHSVDSPTTAEATDRLSHLDVDEDTVMSEFGEEPEEKEDGPSELERELARSAEKPAPLFAKKAAPASQDESGSPGSESSQDIEQSTATLHARQPSTLSNGERTPYDTELDGSPVVGDLLKLKFVEHQVVPTILDFFFRFPWNNFLHNVVYDVVQQVFNGTLDRGYNRTLAFDLFTPAQGPGGKTAEEIGLASGSDITDRILDGQAKSDESQKHKGMRLGYMGHLTLIAEEVCKFGSKYPADALDPAITERVTREAWVSYVEGTLAETRDKDNAVLGGVRPENAIGIRAMGMGGGGLSSGFSSNTQNTLASAGLGGSSNMTPQDSLALQEGTVGQSFEINSGTMLSGFSDNDEDEEMEDEAITRERERQRAFDEDEQVGELSFDVDMDYR